jgi:hypothetical protein
MKKDEEKTAERRGNLYFVALAFVSISFGTLMPLVSLMPPLCTGSCFASPRPNRSFSKFIAVSDQVQSRNTGAMLALRQGKRVLPGAVQPCDTHRSYLYPQQIHHDHHAPSRLVGRGARMASQDRKQGPRGPTAEGTGCSRRSSPHSFADMHLHTVDLRGVSWPKRGGRSRILHIQGKLSSLKTSAQTFSGRARPAIVRARVAYRHRPTYMQGASAA